MEIKNKKSFNNLIKSLTEEILDEEDLDETTGTGAVAGYNTPFAFTGGDSNKEKKKKRKKNSNRKKVDQSVDEKYLKKIGEGTDWDYRSLFVRGAKYSGFKLQRYIKNEGHYNAIHQERDGTTVYKRMFVIMAYLNTVSDGGKTKFPYFDISVQPSRGAILIWPAGMPYLHYGEIPISEHKFIMTTWLEQVNG